MVAVNHMTGSARARRLPRDSPACIEHAALLRLFEILDSGTEEGRRLYSRDCAMVKRDRKRECRVAGRPPVFQDDPFIQTTHTENGHLWGDHDELRKLASDHAKVGQGDRLSSELARRHGPCAHILLERVESLLEVLRRTLSDVTQNRYEETVRGIDGDAEIDVGVQSPGRLRSLEPGIERRGRSASGHDGADQTKHDRDRCSTR